MASSKEKLVERLEQIKADAAALAVDEPSRKGANLAEEAAGLGLEIAELAKEKK